MISLNQNMFLQISRNFIWIAFFQNISIWFLFLMLQIWNTDTSFFKKWKNKTKLQVT